MVTHVKRSSMIGCSAVYPVPISYDTQEHDSRNRTHKNIIIGWVDPLESEIEPTPTSYFRSSRPCLMLPSLWTSPFEQPLIETSLFLYEAALSTTLALFPLCSTGDPYVTSLLLWNSPQPSWR